MKVQSFGERIVLFILNVVIFGRLERNLDDDDMFFLPHSVKEEAKILWRDGAAVGFYTTKRKGEGCACREAPGACLLGGCPEHRRSLERIFWREKCTLDAKIYRHYLRKEGGWRRCAFLTFFPFPQCGVRQLVSHASKSCRSLFVKVSHRG
ncbi:hypothetical protein FD755_019447 [Muntiacus reevesi]|uniref:Uncharacterized protein n=1 Tax=Muntiacus reevesi TaxID=9886 RepID=A0A5N3X6J6_MUNRE|nr:hypothetical protein FD755_019447 [Muntiacus reevesi]